jgi:hypothetical protein
MQDDRGSPWQKLISNVIPNYLGGWVFSAAALTLSVFRRRAGVRLTATIYAATVPQIPAVQRLPDSGRSGTEPYDARARRPVWSLARGHSKLSVARGSNYTDEDRTL